MKKISIFFVLALLFVPVLAQGATINGATSDLSLQATITFGDTLVMTFVPGTSPNYHGANGAYAYVYTDVGGAVEVDEGGESGWNPSSSYSETAGTSNGEANGGVKVNTADVPYPYDIEADAIVEGLNIGDYGYAMGYAYAWPDWLEVTSAGTATITLDYTYTLDTNNTCNNAEAHVYMNAFFADHAGDNRLTAKDDWALGYGDNLNTTIVEYSDSIPAGQYLKVTDSVSWEIYIDPDEPDEDWFSLWAFGKAEVEVAPVPIPASVLLLASGLLGLVGIKRFRNRG